jgi:hypothetical protein
MEPVTALVEPSVFAIVEIQRLYVEDWSNWTVAFLKGKIESRSVGVILYLSTLHQLIL